MVEETGVSRESHRPVTSHCQTLSVTCDRFVVFSGYSRFEEYIINLHATIIIQHATIAKQILKRVLKL